MLIYDTAINFTPVYYESVYLLARYESGLFGLLLIKRVVSIFLIAFAIRKVKDRDFYVIGNLTGKRVN